MLLVSAGIMLCEIAPGSWWTETSAFQSTVGKWIAFTWIMCLASKFFVISRAPKEDTVLRETFGNKWDDYADRVRYRFLPGII